MPIHLTYIHVHIYNPLCIYIHIYIYTHVYIYVYMYNIHICIYICMYVCEYVYMYTMQMGSHVGGTHRVVFVPRTWETMSIIFDVAPDCAPCCSVALCCSVASRQVLDEAGCCIQHTQRLPNKTHGHPCGPCSIHIVSYIYIYAFCTTRTTMRSLYYTNSVIYIYMYIYIYIYIYMYSI